MADINIPALLQKLIGDYDAARTERQQRFETGKTELGKIVEMYGGGEASDKISKTAMTAAKSGMAGVGGKVPGKLSKSFQSAIKRTTTTGKAKALSTRAAFQNAFPNLYPGPSALVNLATGGFAGLTRQLEAESLGGPLSDPYDYLSTSNVPSRISPETARF